MTKTITCDSCDVLIVNNVICHESGCSNSWCDSKRECNWCGQTFNPLSEDQTCCDQSCAQSYYS